MFGLPKKVFLSCLEKGVGAQCPAKKTSPHIIPQKPYFYERIGAFC